MAAGAAEPSVAACDAGLGAGRRAMLTSACVARSQLVARLLRIVLGALARAVGSGGGARKVGRAPVTSGPESVFSESIFSVVRLEVSGGATIT